jgi:phenylpropionate dioxygenase-like ring-hydroxylating dioxygenase large terminal subunit
MFLKNAWYVAGWGDEIGRELKQQWVTGEPLVLYRTEDGRAVALEDRCPHRRFALSKGTLIGDTIECGYHGLVFDCDGKCVQIPGQPNIPPRMRARQYPVRERWRLVWVWMGDPAKADESLIPDFSWHDDHENWRFVGGKIDMEAHYQLLIDNLLDLTHETFVHQRTIGNFAVAETPMNCTVEDKTVRVERVMRDIPAPPLFTKVRGFSGMIDRWQIIDFAPPSTVVIDARAVPTGTNDIDQGMRWMVVNAITPQTERSSRYFYSVTRCFATDDASLDKVIGDQIYATFEEDKEVIEVQQHLIDTDAADRRVYDINADAGGVAARRITAKLIAEEQPAAA